MIEKVNLSEKFGLFTEHWSPKIAGEVNDAYVKLVKFRGEFVIIPRGVEHKPVAAEEAHVLLFEPKTVLNTGDVVNEMTQPQLGRV